MRTLLLFRGAPGSGKSTFIERHGLKRYTLSADEIRLQCQGPQLSINGEVEISQKNDNVVWKILFDVLEIRMQNGEFTVIDATNSKTAEINRYKELADKYRYRIYCIDFTSVPINECKRRNAMREPIKRVPDSVIDKIYARFANQKIPSGVKVISENDLSVLKMKKIDLSHYKQIVHIGNINGCYSALMKYFKNGLNDDYLYIFCGNLIGNGIENAEVVKFMLSIYEKPNVYILEAPTSRYLWNIANGEIPRRDALAKHLVSELKGFNDKHLRMLYRKFGQCAWYSYHNNDFIVSAGNIPAAAVNLTFVPTSQLVYGVGSDEDLNKVADAWLNKTVNNFYNINSRKNITGAPIQLNDRMFNLDNGVEYGGKLRILEIGKNCISKIEIENDVVRTEKTPEPIETNELIISLKNNKFIKEREFGSISSFNFTEQAFNDSIWNNQTIIARGLFLDNKTGDVVARGYNKFFSINERPETKLDVLQHHFKFPISCYVKENGYLGLVSYNKETDDLFITSKSSPESEYAEWFKDLLYKKLSSESIDKIKKFSKENNVTFIFEVIDVENDPHIIEYSENDLFLLAIVHNDIEFSQYTYEQLLEIGHALNLKVKTRAKIITNWRDFYSWYTEVITEDYKFNNKHIEGFVVEDASGFMVKIKLHYYKFWKFMRGVAYETLKKGYIQKTGPLVDKMSNEFYAFCQKLYRYRKNGIIDNVPNNIIELRKHFLKNKTDY